MKTKSTDDFFDFAPAITCNKPSGQQIILDLVKGGTK